MWLYLAGGGSGTLTDYPTGTVTFLFTDIVDSSRLWEEHHAAMQVALAKHDAILSTAVSDNDGLLIKQTGDGVFAVFSSAFAAIDATSSIRGAMVAEAWGEVPDFAVRVGVHTGEAQLRDGDYFGPTVNRAARVMGTADGGEVVLSAATQEVVRDRLPDGLVLRDLGNRSLKGMSRPEHVFLLGYDGANRASTNDQWAGPAASPSVDDVAKTALWIAVLPFENMSGDPEQEYFADGISEDVMTGLSAFRTLRVISRTSSFSYKGSSATISEIASDLGVRFVLEGSVRRAGSRVRVSAQLVDAHGSDHIWADRYDTDIVDIFEAQDAITRDIVLAISPAIRGVESARVARVRPESLDAWDLVQRGWSEFFKYKKSANAAAREFFEAAADMDATYAEARSALAFVHAGDAWLRWSDDTGASLEVAYRQAKFGVELDPGDAVAHSALAFANYAMGRFDGAVLEADRAIALNPSFSYAYMWGGNARNLRGDPRGGLAMLTQAIALAPHDSSASFVYGGLALSHFLLAELDDAVADSRAAVRLRHGYMFARVLLTASLFELGNTEDARGALGDLLDIDPDFNPSYLDMYQFGDADRRRLIDALIASGLDI